MAIMLRMLQKIGPWTEALQQRYPGESIVTSTDEMVEMGIEPEAIDYIVGWKVKWHELHLYPNLKGVLLSSAGIDHLDWDVIPDDLPVVRLIDPSMTNEIAAYAVHWVVHFTRFFDRYRGQQDTTTWQVEQREHIKTVGVLGLGAIGTVVADRMTDFDYPVVSWSRSAKDTPYGRHYVGAQELEEFFQAADLVVNLLPLSDATRHIVGAQQLSALGDGVMINAGRGGTIDTDALLTALNGDLHAAVLDVFETEPLPDDSPLWNHPKVTITPHIAGETNPYTATQVIAANIDRINRDEEPYPKVTRTTY